MFVYTTNPNSTLYTNFTKHQLSIWKQMKDLHSIEQDWFSAAVGNWLIDMSESNYLGNFFWSNTYTNTWVCYIIFHHFLCWIVFQWAWTQVPNSGYICIQAIVVSNISSWTFFLLLKQTFQFSTEYIHYNTAPLWVNIYYWLIFLQRCYNLNFVTTSIERSMLYIYNM